MAKEKDELNFEQNLEELEKIVKDLENGNVPLDEAIDKFTKATKLAAICDEKLKNAEESVNKILNKDNKLEEFNIED